VASESELVEERGAGARRRHRRAGSGQPGGRGPRGRGMGEAEEGGWSGDGGREGAAMYLAAGDSKVRGGGRTEECLVLFRERPSPSLDSEGIQSSGALNWGTA
jgi:hypothetical protein